MPWEHNADGSWDPVVEAKEDRRPLIMGIVLVVSIVVAFVLGWNAGADQEREKLIGSGDAPTGIYRDVSPFGFRVV